MSVFRAKVWSGVGAAIVLGAGGLAACSGEDGEAGGAAAPAESPGATGGEGEGEGGAATPPAPGGEGEGEGAAAAGGEQGAASAYAAVPAESRRAFRLAQLKGFFLAAKSVGAVEGPEAAAALAGQGLLEVYDPARAEIAGPGFDEAPLRAAAQSGAPAALQTAIGALDAAEAEAGGDPRAVARGLTQLTVGLYREATAAGTLDPTEYQHAYAAALAAGAVAARESELSRAKGDIDRLARLWRTPVAPDDAAKAPKLAEVQAQASRVELALSGA